MHLPPFFVQIDRPQQRLGFTLIELLVVVAIIVLLIAILIPSLGRAKSKARTVVCLTHLREIGVGFGTYSADYTNTLPAPLITIPQRVTNLPIPVSSPWQLAIWQYTTHTDLTTTQLLGYQNTSTTTSTYLLNTIFICPQGALNPRSLNYENCGYAMNSDLPDGPLTNSTDSIVPYTRTKRIQPLIDPSDTLYAADGDNYYVKVDITGNKVLDGMVGGAVFDDVALSYEQNRHNLCINALMGDGSASTKGWINSSDIPSYLNGQSTPSAATAMPPAFQLFWYGTYAPGGEFTTASGGGGL
jgi:prepilin-type N-terminal cleavage/methylation domain-containing protein